MNSISFRNWPLHSSPSATRFIFVLFALVFSLARCGGDDSANPVAGATDASGVDGSLVDGTSPRDASSADHVDTFEAGPMHRDAETDDAEAGSPATIDATDTDAFAAADAPDSGPLPDASVG